MDRPQPGLERIKAVLAQLGHPERCAPAIHIAGTNGKGSTLAFLDEILQASALTTARLTSPHLVHVGERLRLNGRVTPLESMEEALREVWSVPGGEELTYFESVVTASFLLARAASPDLLLVETGLGGRWDATNLVDTRLHLFSPIDIDHTAYLGDSLTAIAQEKGGIIRSAAPVISAPQVESVEEALRQTAGNFNAPWQLLVEGDDFDGSWLKARFRWKGDWLPAVELPLPGDHQVVNAALAIAAAQRLVPELDGLVVLKAIRQTQWAGRLERCLYPLPAGGEIEVVLDGAHNPAGMVALSDYLRTTPVSGETHILLGVMEDKDVALMVQTLLALGHPVGAVGWEEDRALDQEGWAKKAPMIPFRGEAVQALGELLSVCRSGDRIVVVGSLHLLGWVRRQWTCTTAA